MRSPLGIRYGTLTRLRERKGGFQEKFEPARDFSPEDEKKWLMLEASPVCDQRAWKKSKRNGADKEV
jgi:hypothetical protein